MNLSWPRAGGLLSSAIAVALITFIAKLAGAGKELVVAWRFGIDAELGAFLFAFIFPAFLLNVIAGAMQVAMVPRYVALRVDFGTTAASHFAARVGSVTVIAFLMGILLLTPLVVTLVPVLATGFDSQTVDLCRRFLVLLMPTALLTGVSAIWVGVLNAEGAFRYTSLVPLTTPLIAASCVFMLGDTLRVEALLWGTLAGVMLETVLLGARVRLRGMPLLAAPGGLDGEMRRVLGQFGPLALANILMAGSIVIEQSFAASVAAEDVAAYAFGTRLTAVVAAVLVTTLSTILLPHLSGIVAGSGVSALRRQVVPIVAAVMLVSVPAAAIFGVGSEWITRLVFERGSFDSNASALVSEIQAAHALYIPLYALGMVAVRLVNALAASKVLLVGAAMNLAASYILNTLFVPLLGVVGIAWANVGVYGVSATFLWFFVIRRLLAAGPGAGSK